MLKYATPNEVYLISYSMKINICLDRGRILLAFILLHEKGYGFIFQ